MRRPLSQRKCKNCQTFFAPDPALHQKSGQYADLSVNKTFLASF